MQMIIILILGYYIITAAVAASISLFIVTNDHNFNTTITSISFFIVSTTCDYSNLWFCVLVTSALLSELSSIWHIFMGLQIFVNDWKLFLTSA